MVASLCIEYTPPADSTKRFNVFFLSEISSTLKIAAGYPSLITAMFGSAFFMFLGAFVQLNMIPFAVQSLDLSDTQGGYLFLLTAIGIGSGSILAGKISGKIAELGLVPLAGLGIIFSCFMLDCFSANLFVVLPLVVLIGLFGGMYEIPLDSHIQLSSPNTSRGQVIAVTNFFSFVGVLGASALVYLTTEIFGFKADKGFMIMGSLTVIMTSILTFQYFDYLTRFIAMILCKIHFRTTLSGGEHIPYDKPAIYVCTHTAWNDTLLMLGAQRRRMRFFIENEQEHDRRWIHRLYRMLRVILNPAIEPLENNPICLTVIKNSLKKGISVCIFVDNDNLDEEIEKLNSSYSFNDILDETTQSIIPVIIEKGEKNNSESMFTRLLRKIRVPAAISFG